MQFGYMPMGFGTLIAYVANSSHQYQDYIEEDYEDLDHIAQIAGWLSAYSNVTLFTYYPTPAHM